MKSPHIKNQPKSLPAAKAAPAIAAIESTSMPNVRRTGGSSAPQARAGSLYTTTDFTIGKVESATDLGEGYVIVKLHDPSVPSKPVKQPVANKPISIATVHRLLRKLANQQATSNLASDAEQADNDAFIANMQEEAMRGRARLLSEGKLLASAELCERLQVSRQALSKAVAENRMFALDGPGGRKLYPAFFADPSLPRRELERMAQSLGPLPGASKWQFFTTPASSLAGKTPIEALARGQYADVLRACAGFKERELGD